MVANGLSIMYLLLTGMSLIVMKSSENQQQYNDILKQFMEANKMLLLIFYLHL